MYTHYMVMLKKVRYLILAYKLELVKNIMKSLLFLLYPIRLSLLCAFWVWLGFFFLTKQGHHNNFCVHFWVKQGTLRSNQPEFAQDVIDLIAFHHYRTALDILFDCQTRNSCVSPRINWCILPSVRRNWKVTTDITKQACVYYIKFPNQTFKKIIWRQKYLQSVLQELIVFISFPNSRLKLCPYSCTRNRQNQKARESLTGGKNLLNWAVFTHLPLSPKALQEPTKSLSPNALPFSASIRTIGGVYSWTSTLHTKYDSSCRS